MSYNFIFVLCPHYWQYFFSKSLFLGYYRVNYDDLSWQLIIDLLNSNDYDKVHLLNRNQLLEDAFNLAKAGLISYTVTLDLVSYLERETDYVPLYTFFKGLPSLNTYLTNTGEYYELFQVSKVFFENSTLFHIRSRGNR